MGARNRVGTKLSYRPTCLCSLAGRYDNLIPTWLLAPIDCSKIPALMMESVVSVTRGAGALVLREKRRIEGGGGGGS